MPTSTLESRIQIILFYFMWFFAQRFIFAFHIFDLYMKTLEGIVFVDINPVLLFDYIENRVVLSWSQLYVYPFKKPLIRSIVHGPYIYSCRKIKITSPKSPCKSSKVKVSNLKSSLCSGREKVRFDTLIQMNQLNGLVQWTWTL